MNLAAPLDFIEVPLPVDATPQSIHSHTLQPLKEHVDSIAGTQRQQYGGLLRLQEPHTSGLNERFVTWQTGSNHSVLRLREWSLTEKLVNDQFEIRLQPGDLSVPGGVKLFQLKPDQNGQRSLCCAIATPGGSTYFLRFRASLDGQRARMGSKSMSIFTPSSNRTPILSCATASIAVESPESAVTCASWLTGDHLVHVSLGSANGTVTSVAFRPSATVDQHASVAASVTEFEASSLVQKLWSGLVNATGRRQPSQDVARVIAVQSVAYRSSDSLYLFALGSDSKVNVWSVSQQMCIHSFALQRSGGSLNSARMYVHQQGTHNFSIAVVGHYTASKPESFLYNGSFVTENNIAIHNSSPVKFLHNQANNHNGFFGMKICDVLHWNDWIFTLWWDEAKPGCTTVVQHAINSQQLAADNRGIQITLDHEREDWKFGDLALQGIDSVQQLEQFSVQRLSIPGRYDQELVAASANRCLGINVQNSGRPSASRHGPAFFDQIIAAIRSTTQQTPTSAGGRNLDVARNMWKLLLEDCDRLFNENTQPLAISLDAAHQVDGMHILVRTSGLSILRPLTSVEYIPHTIATDGDAGAIVNDAVFRGNQSMIDCTRLCLGLFEQNRVELDKLVTIAAHSDGPLAFASSLRNALCSQPQPANSALLDTFFESFGNLPSHEIVNCVHMMLDELLDRTNMEVDHHTITGTGGSADTNSAVASSNKYYLCGLASKSIKQIAESCLRISMGVLTFNLLVRHGYPSRGSRVYAQGLTKSSDPDFTDRLLLKASVAVHNFVFLQCIGEMAAPVVDGAKVEDTELPNTLVSSMMSPTLANSHRQRDTGGRSSRGRVFNAFAPVTNTDADAATSVLMELVIHSYDLTAARLDAGQEATFTKRLESVTLLALSKFTSFHRVGGDVADQDAQLQLTCELIFFVRSLGNRELLRSYTGYLVCFAQDRGVVEWRRNMAWRIIHLIHAEATLGLALHSDTPLESQGNVVDAAVTQLQRCAPVVGDDGMGTPDRDRQLAHFEFLLGLAKYLEKLQLPKQATELVFSALATIQAMEDVDPLRTVLLSNMFTFAMSDKQLDYRLAMQAIVSHQDTDRRKHYVRQLVATLLEREEYECLCSLPLHLHQDLKEIVIDCIQHKAEWSSLPEVIANACESASGLGISPYHVWYTYAFNTGRYVAAAEAMYSYSRALSLGISSVGAQSAGPKPAGNLKALAQARVDALASVVTCLQLVPENDAVVVVRGSSAANNNKTVSSVHLKELEKEYSEAICLLKLVEKGIFDPTCLTDTLLVVRLLLQAELIEEAADLCVLQGFDLEPFGPNNDGVFSTLTRLCVNSGSDEGPWWVLLRKYLAQFDMVTVKQPVSASANVSEKVHLATYRYHAVVLNVLLEQKSINQKGDQPLPQWLLRSFVRWGSFETAVDSDERAFAGSESNPVMCARLLLHHNHLLDACQIIVDLIPNIHTRLSNVKGFVNELCWIPCNLIDELVHACEAILSSPTSGEEAKAQVKKMQTKLEDATREFFKLVIKSAPSRDMAFLRNNPIH